jgi:hypothetical protein
MVPFHSQDVPVPPFLPTVAVIGQYCKSSYITDRNFFTSYHSVPTLTSSVTLKMESVYSSIISLHLTSTRCRNPKEDCHQYARVIKL